MTKKEQFKPFSAVFLVLIHEEQILLLRRYNCKWLPGYYSVVAGHLDGGETAKQAIIREAKEEANIILKQEDLKVAHVMHRSRSNREYIDIYLTANKWEGEIRNMEPEKHDKLDWYPVNKLPDVFLPEVKLALENIENGISYGKFGW